MTEENVEPQPQPQDLATLVQAAKAARLSPADEDRVAALLKEQLSAGPKALPEALAAMTELSWAIGVKAVSEAWPELKPAARTRLIASLARMDSEAARRLRLSVARGLYAADPAAARKLILGVCEAMLGAEGGPSQRDRQVFANVLLGKAKPWLANVSLADSKPAEAQKIVDAALEAGQQAPIFTHIWVLRWIADSEKFDAVSPGRMEGLAKAIQRWQPRWKKELQKLVTKLPPALEEALGQTLEKAEPETAQGGGEAQPANEPRPPKPQQQQPKQQRHAPHREERRGKQEPAARGFDLARALHDIENYVGRLQSEMQLLQVAAHRPEPGQKRQQAPSQGSVSNAEADELRRHNEQLQEQNRDLRHQLEELAADHEDRASTLALDDAVEQFRTLLGLKLKEDFADFSVLSRESQTDVVRRHAQEMLAHVFGVLKAEGVRFEGEAG